MAVFFLFDCINDGIDFFTGKDFWVGFVWIWENFLGVLLVGIGLSGSAMCHTIKPQSGHVAREMRVYKMELRLNVMPLGVYFSNDPDLGFYIYPVSRFWSCASYCCQRALCKCFHLFTNLSVQLIRKKKNKLQETLKIQLHYCTFLSIPKAPFSSKLFKKFFNLFFNVLFVQENWNSKISERKKDSNIFCKKMEIGIGWEKWLSWFLRWSLKSLSKSNLASGTMRNR